MKILIKSGHIIDPRNKIDGISDILIENSIISKMGTIDDTQGEFVIDAEGLHVFPGFVDAHCHLREPGYEYKEDIESGTRAAAAGGFTAVACMPNTNPVADNDAVIKFIVDKAMEKGVVKVYPIGSITKGSQGEQLAEMGFMKAAGAMAVSDDGNPVKNDDVMRKAMIYANDFNLPVISHCEIKSLSEGGSVNEGFVSTTMGIKGIPKIAEEIQVARDVLLAEYTGVPVHIAHISTGRSADIIRDAKKRGVRVTCETCPHYFSLTDDECIDFNTDSKVNPPLRSNNDRLAIIEALMDGTIDMIATDHAPHHADEKRVEFEYAANGISGFETAFSAAYKNLVITGYINISRLVELMSYGAGKLFDCKDKGISVGSPADITIVDLSEKFIVDSGKFISKGKNTPFNGKELQGKIKTTLVDGKISFGGDK